MGGFREIAHDILSGDQADEAAPVVRHGHKVLVQRLADQVFDVGVGADGQIVHPPGDLGDGDIFRLLKIQVVLLFQGPQQVALGERAHIIPFSVENGDGGIAVKFHFFQSLTNGKIVVNIRHLAFRR